MCVALAARVRGLWYNGTTSITQKWDSTNSIKEALITESGKKEMDVMEG